MLTLATLKSIKDEWECVWVQILNSDPAYVRNLGRVKTDQVLELTDK